MRRVPLAAALLLGVASLALAAPARIDPRVFQEL